MPSILPATWSAAETALWERIRSHPFEHPDQVLDFTRRLARDRDWSLAFARAAVEAYRRFCFLACTSGEPVTPSEEVDEVWHLHLTYSRDYWEVWCGAVLRTALHHNPTSGGPAEQGRYARQYAATLARHEAYFGPPDPALWPGTGERFGRRPRYRIVDTRRSLVVARPRLGRRLLPALAGAILLAPRPALALPLNPLDWPGPPFLWLDGILAAGALLVGVVLRARCRQAVRMVPSSDLGLPELAYLAGGPDRVADVTALALHTCGAGNIDPPRGLWVSARGIALPPDIEAFRPPDGLATRGQLMRRLAGPTERLAERLAARGLCPSAAQRRRTLVVSLSAVALVLALGLAKVGWVAGTGRPVGYLVGLMIATVIAAVVIHIRPITCTTAGAQALDRHRARHARAARAPLRHEIPFAFALGGAAALVGTEFASLRRFFVTDSGGGDGSGSAGDGGSGGGGGCGGCGGGGGD
ncbi:TIGR04222 domain-containing membrane protein [Methylobacterium indicum]|uniref:TIGR04222 domain-containing membrane protein n=1 Tax=Methylobacterium indicum TaxID=1775910 RepID=UPI002434D79C|nr:TIGR04222 domain-containing membrane protein [Methylobacterium indicum]